ncbi:lactoylglutathione lyase [Spatholobus suberectus]|nr:lactoylglutathione lyase [Spatholobus suberectus]
MRFYEEVGNCGTQALPLLSLNHVSLLCRSVWESMRFYNYGVGIHLIENPDIHEFDTCVNELRPINPKDNHISFQCTDVELVKKRLEERGMRFLSLWSSIFSLWPQLASSFSTTARSGDGGVVAIDGRGREEDFKPTRIGNGRLKKTTPFSTPLIPTQTCPITSQTI